MIRYVLRNVVNDQLINAKSFDNMVAAMNYRMTYLERDTAWVDRIEVQECTNPDLILDPSKPAYIVRTL
jgi:hypothetical protein|tara:strand:+ start:950 stop:1156 length:207 start_codon:yes stop_codon:yes gene_type:complete